jgi:uncharacterized protein involved in outer membrane biogenesis
MPRRWRLILLALGGLALTVVVVAVIAVYLLLQPDRFTAMLQAQARANGLELNLSSPASPTLFPRPALELSGITINAQDANVPILLAARGRLALPWRTLLSGPTVISQLQIDAPRVDLEALQAWVAALPAKPGSAPTDIPSIRTGVSIVRGSIVRGDQLLLGNVSLDTGSLISGQPFPLSVSATTAAGLPLQLRLSATPRIHDNSLQLDNVDLQLSQGKSLTLALKGSVRWHGAADAAADLTGTLDQRSGADDASVQSYAMSLVLTPADQTNPLLLALKLDGPDNHVDMRLPPLALTRWWNQLGGEQALPLTTPPASGHLEIARLQAAGVTIEGLTLDSGDSVPAPTSDAARGKTTAGKSGAGKPAVGKPATRKDP